MRNRTAQTIGGLAGIVVFMLGFFGIMFVFEPVTNFYLAAVAIPALIALVSYGGVATAHEVELFAEYLIRESRLQKLRDRS